MTFLGGTAFLGWLAVALLPLLVYWLLRRRKTVLRWSANLILRRTIERGGRRAFWRQATILALRVLVLLLLVLALARPLWPQAPPAGALPHGEGILHQIILLDNSDSLSIAYQGHTRDSELRARLRTLLERLQPGDVAELIPLAVPAGERLAPWTVSVPLTPRDWQALDERLRRQPGQARWQDGLQVAAERFHVTSSQHRHLILLSDFSAADLPPASELARLAPVFAGLRVRLAGYHLQDRERPNLAIEALESGSPRLLAGWRHHLFVQLRNHGREVISGALALQLWRGQERLGDQQVPIELLPGETQWRDLRLTAPATGGPLSVRVSVSDEAYQLDNELRLELSVSQALRVLLVTPPASATERPLWQEGTYLESAFGAGQRPVAAASGPATSGHSFTRDPQTGAIRQVSHQPGAATSASERPALVLSVTRRAPAELSAADLANHELLVLANCDSLPPELKPALTQWLRQGGGLLLGLGDAVVAERFQEFFGELLPAPILRPWSEVARKRPDWEYDEPHRTIEKTFSHPLLRRFLDEAEGDLEHVRLYNYFLTGPASAPPLMVLSSGDPLLLARDFGRGRVLLYTSSLGGSWNTMPVRNAYPTLLHAWLAWLAGGLEPDRNPVAGAPLFLPADAGGNLTVLPPAGEPRELAPRTVNGRAWYRLDDLESPGEYSFLRDTQEVARLAWRGELAESACASPAPAELRALATALGGTISADWADLPAALATPEFHGWRLAAPLLLLLLLALALDGWLTRRWFH